MLADKIYILSISEIKTKKFDLTRKTLYVLYDIRYNNLAMLSQVTVADI